MAASDGECGRIDVAVHVAVDVDVDVERLGRTQRLLGAATVG